MKTKYDKLHRLFEELDSDGLYDANTEYTGEQKMKTKTPIHLEDIPVKVYQDGSRGDYFCQCTSCLAYFLGVKRDAMCSVCSPLVAATGWVKVQTRKTGWPL